MSIVMREYPIEIKYTGLTARILQNAIYIVPDVPQMKSGQGSSLMELTEYIFLIRVIIIMLPG